LQCSIAIIKYNYKVQISLFGNSAVSLSFGNIAIFFRQEVTGLPFCGGWLGRARPQHSKDEAGEFLSANFPNKT
jgi:hypothetical protein